MGIETLTIRKKRFVALAFGLAFAAFLIELSLRIAGVSFQDFYKADPVRGVAHRPGARGWFRREGRQYIVINRGGFRDRERPAGKPPGAYRIALLGDSFTEGLQVNLEDTFGAVLERELAGCPKYRGRSVEVFNFGVSNYGTAQELLTLRDRVWEVEPDLVLLAFFSGNDVWDNSRELKRDPELPYFTLKDGKLALDDSFRGSPRQQAEKSAARAAIRGLIESFRILQVVRQAWGVARSGPGRAAPSAVDGPDIGPSHRQIYAEPTEPAWRSAWEVTERLIRTMSDEVSRRGAEFAVVTLTNGVQVHPDPLEIERARARLGVPDLDYPDRRIGQLGESAGFGVLNLTPAFRRYASENRAFLHGIGPGLGTGHWNREGHRLAGRLIATWLCERGR